MQTSHSETSGDLHTTKSAAISPTDTKCVPNTVPKDDGTNEEEDMRKKLAAQKGRKQSINVYIRKPKRTGQEHIVSVDNLSAVIRGRNKYVDKTISEGSESSINPENIETPKISSQNDVDDMLLKDVQLSSITVENEKSSLTQNISLENVLEEGEGEKTVRREDVIPYHDAVDTLNEVTGDPESQIQVERASINLSLIHI